MTEEESHWYNVFGELAQQAYAEPGSESPRLLNVMNRAKMAADPEYVATISYI